MKKKISPYSKQFIFVLSILLISTITGVFTAFFAGISERNFYTDSNNNVIVITQPQAKSPIGSYIPSSLTNVLGMISGIKVVSPEVYSLVMINNRPATLHGINSSFLQITSYKLIEGLGFDSLNNSLNNNYLIIGKTAATTLNLVVGQKYEIFSTTSRSYATYTVKGIVSFGSIYDEELFTSIPNAQFFRPTSARSDLSLIRVEVNTNQTSKDALDNLLHQSFDIRVIINSQLSKVISLNATTVTVFTTNGEFVTENTTNSNGTTMLSLPIGEYDFLIRSPSSHNTIIYREIILSDRNLNFFLNDFVDVQPQESSNVYNMTIKTFYENSTVNGAHLNIIAPNGRYINVNSSINTILLNIPDGTYTIIAFYNGTYDREDVILNNNMQVNINFTSVVVLQALSTTGTNIDNFSCSIFDYSDNNSIYLPKCPISVFLEKSLYKFTFSSPIYGNTSFNYAITNSSTFYVIGVLGNISTHFTFLDASNHPLANQQVFGRSTADNNYSYLGLTDSSGNFTLVSNPRSTWMIQVNNSLQSESFIYNTPDYNSTESIQLQNSFNFQINVFEGSTSLSIPIKNATVNVRTLNGQSFTQYTNASGVANFPFTSEQIVDVNVDYATYNKSIDIISTLNQKIVNLSLGEIGVNLSTKIINVYPMTFPFGADVEVYSFGKTQSFTIESGGDIFLTLPTSTYYNADYNLFYSNFDQNLQYFNPDFFLNFAYLIKVSWQGFTNILIIPKGYFSNYYLFNIAFAPIFTANIHLQDLLGEAVYYAQVALISTTTNKIYYGVSDSEGLVVINNVRQGFYEIDTKFNGITFTNYLWLNTTNTDLTIQMSFISSNIKFQAFDQKVSALSGRQFIAGFYSTSASLFTQIIIILAILIIVVLILLFSSTMRFVIESHYSEIFSLRIIGASIGQISINLIFQMQVLIVISSFIGLLFGTTLTFLIPNFQNIELVGFIVRPKFSLDFFIISLLTISIFSFFILVYSLLKVDWKHPIEVMENLQQRNN